MLKRTITDRLIDWKNTPDHRCLMVRGPRQVGKTFSITRFIETEYESHIVINFLENSSYKKIFSGDLDIKTILTNISLYVRDSKIIPGNCCLFLDEIQECPEAITALKFLAQSAELDVIASGSMLGIDYNRPVSYPVGSVEYIDMYALSFDEFLMAMGVSDEVNGKLEQCFIRKEQVPWAVHDKMMEYLRLYMVLGGMPEVINAYLRDYSIADADRKQREILEDYRYDIAHYASSDIKIKAERCYFSLPDQLLKDNHKFSYSVVEKGGTRRKYGSSLDWLTGAYLIKHVYNISGYEMPLSSLAMEDNFRVYTTDIGLLMGMYDYTLKEMILMPEDEKTKLYNLNKHLKGSIYEALIADILIKNGHKELYFRKTEGSTFEIDFIIETRDGIVPIEVKAGNSRSKSLDNLLKRDEIPYGYKFMDSNVGVSEKKITMPLYMAKYIKQN